MPVRDNNDIEFIRNLCQFRTAYPRPDVTWEASDKGASHKTFGKTKI